MFCIFSLVMSTMSLSGISLFYSPVVEAQVAGTLALEVIDHKPAIQLNEPGTTTVQRD